MSTATSGFPIVTHDLAQFEATDLPPFKAAIAAGVDTIMTAHVVFPAVDPSGAPATMSHKILTGVLRDELGFKGLIVTDALDMAGATSTYPPDVAPVQAILAGADQLLVPPQMDTAYGAVLDAVRSGAISRQRLDESVYRILLHKYQHGIFRQPFVDPAVGAHRDGRARPPRRRAGDHRPHHDTGEERQRPAAAGRRSRARCSSPGWGVGTTQTTRERAGRTRRDDAGPRVGDHALVDGDRTTVRSVRRRVPTSVVVSTNNAYAVDATTGQPTASAAAQTRLVRALLATGKPVVVAAMRNPYDVASFPEAPTVLDTYGYTGDQVVSLVRVLFGEVNPTGRLPVSIPRADGTGELYPFGYGLRLLTTGAVLTNGGPTAGRSPVRPRVKDRSCRTGAQGCRPRTQENAQLPGSRAPFRCSERKGEQCPGAVAAPVRSPPSSRLPWGTS